MIFPGKILQRELEWIPIKGNDMQHIFEFAIVETWGFSWIFSSAWWDALLAAYQCFRSCHLTVLTLRSETSRKMGSAISSIQLTRINFAGRNMQIRFYILGKDFFPMALTDFTRGSDILANRTTYDIRLLRPSSGHLFKINLNAMFYNLLKSFCLMNKITVFCVHFFKLQ